MLLNRKTLNRENSYTFSDYFKMSVDEDELIEFFDYKYQKIELKLARDMESFEWFDFVKKSISSAILNFKLSNEMARREFLIAPILLALSTSLVLKVNSEKSIYFDEMLKGTLDYLIQGKHNLIIIEAKNVDILSEFKQLSVEMIALDKLLDSNSPNIIYGAVSIGTEWNFVTLDRDSKLISQDSKFYKIPEELQELISVLTTILEGER
ncbi:MAG: hypothetical protein QM493_05055 [Sulfurovum sp.]